MHADSVVINKNGIYQKVPELGYFHMHFEQRDTINVMTIISVQSVQVRKKRTWTSSGPAAKTLHSQCSSPRFDPGQGTRIPHAAASEFCIPQLKDPTWPRN